jgi:hypothetical protein
MKELIRSNDPVLLSYIDALLKEAGILHEIADVHISVMEGSIAAFPRRVLVDDEDFEEARDIIRTAIANPPQPDAG